MNMSCDELIDIFIKVGGKMKCEYKNKKCIFYPQKISCNYNSSNLDNLLLYFQQDSYKYVSYLPLDKNPKSQPSINSKIHNYQDVSTGGFIVEFYRDENGYIVAPPTKSPHRQILIPNTQTRL